MSDGRWSAGLRLVERAFRTWLVFALVVGVADAQEASGGLRFAHQAADAPLVDVLIDGRALFRDVAFGDVTAYVPLATGRHKVTVFPHRLPESGDVSDSEQRAGDGTSSSESERAPSVRELEPVTAFVTVEPEAHHTVVLSGFYQPPAPERQLGHLSVSVRPGDTSWAITGPRGYAAEFVGDQLLVGIEPGTYTITADREGHRAAAYEAEVQPRRTSTVAIALQESDEVDDDDAQAAESMRRAGGMLPGAPLQLQMFRDGFDHVPPAGHAKIRVVHVSPTSPELKIIAVSAESGAGEGIDLGSVAYPGAAAYVILRAGIYELRFEVAGSRQHITVLDGLRLSAGAVYTLFLSSEPAGARPRIVPTLDAMVGWGFGDP